MKRNIVLALVLTVLCGTALAAPKKSSKKQPFPQLPNLGNVMFVGDSITHGVAAASYRWPLFKIWVDNGIELKEVGVHAKNHSGGVQPNTPYGGATFLNVHSAISSERAYEIAGRINKSGRLENSNIHDWLGLDKDYSGKRRIDPANEMPNCFFMMIGTNDTLSDSGRAGIHSCMDVKQKELLGKNGDMETIIDAMRKGNPKAHIAVTTIPSWVAGRPHNNTQEDFSTIEQYNEKLKAWGRAHKVAVVEVNKGMVDMPGTEQLPFAAHPAMFGRDKLHPSAQGDLIIAGNVAQQLGYAGRTAGLKRKAADKFPLLNNNYTLHSGTSCNYTGTTEAAADGATVEFRFAKNGSFGNGARGGWDKEAAMEVRLATAETSGTLSLSEGYLSWNGAVLYSDDMSKLREAVRISWVAGNSGANIPGGFYVWLGDMLIGEALSGSPREAGAKPMATLFNPKGVADVKLEYIRVDLRHSWAPASKRFSAGNPTFADAAPADAPAAAADAGTVTVKNADDVARLAGGSGVISGGKESGSPRKLVFDAAPVSAKVINLADFDEVHLTNGSAVVLGSLGGAKKLVVDSTSRLGLAPGEYEASVLNSGTIIMPQGTTLNLRAEGTDENEGGTYILNGGTLNANNVRMSNTIRQNGGKVTGLSEETFRGKLDK